MKADLVEGSGLLSDRAVKIEVESPESDGHFWLERLIRAAPDAAFEQATTSWWASEPHSDDTAWPRVAYAGAVRDEDGRATEGHLRVLSNDNIIPRTQRKRWVGLRYTSRFTSALPEMQVCVGWKISCPGQRTFLIDDVMIEAVEIVSDGVPLKESQKAPHESEP